MSFTDDFMSELDKKKKKKKKNSSSTSGTSATGGKSYSEKFMDALGDDISPMPSPTMASIHKYGEDDIAPMSKYQIMAQSKQKSNKVKSGYKLTDFSSVTSAEDFAENSGYKSTKSDKWWSSLTSQYGLSYDDLAYEYINNADLKRDEIKKASLKFSGTNETEFYEKGYDHLTADEVKIYNYLYATGGKKKAEEYLKELAETLNTRKAESEFEDIEGKTALEILRGVDVGLDQFESGTKNFGNMLVGKDDYIAPTSTQILGGMIRQDLADDTMPLWYNFKEKQWEDEILGATAGQFAYDSVLTASNMIPTIAASAASNMIVPGSGIVVGGATMGSSAAGNAYQSALNEGYDKDAAKVYATGVGALEALLQTALGGISKLGGTSKYISKAVSGIDNALLRFSLEFGGRVGSEALEEGLQEVLDPILQNAILGADEDVNWEEVAYSALLGGVMGATMGGDSNNLSHSDQKVVNKVYEAELAKKKEDGKTLTKKEKSKIYDSVVERLEKGQIDIDTIDSMYGGEGYTSYRDAVKGLFDSDTYKDYKKALEEESTLAKEIEELGKKEGATPADNFRYTELMQKQKDSSAAQAERKAYIDAEVEKITGMRTNLTNEIVKKVGENSKLVESYREFERGRQAFEADLSKYTGKKREAVERAVKSGVLNNTYRSHELVDVLSEIEATKGISFDYTNNAKLKESGFAVEGKTVNGFASKSKGAVTLNVQSAKAWESVVGHEITHVLEGTDAYSELRNALYAYAESKGELEGRRAYLNELYQNMDADVEAELTADLVGDYLFTDKDFVSKLTGNRTLFQKIYDEIKYLWNVATGKEKTEIEKVKAEFDRVWKEYSNNNETIEESSESKEYGDADVQYSIREEAPPKETGIAYKVFYVKDGKLYPPMVANPDGADTPMGVWLNADVGTAAPPSKTGRAQVKAGGKGTQGGSGSLAFRPGWHLGDLPRASQFDRVNPETGKKELFPENFVWAEVEYAKDVDYQEEAMSYGYTDNGKFRHAYAGLPRLPENGYYRYRTNPKPDTVPWVITGAMKVNRLLSDAEVNEILEKNGVPAVHRKGGDVGLDKFGFDEKGQVQYSVSPEIESKTLYTGSPNTNIQQFKVGGVEGSRRSGDRYGRGVYLTTNENTAKGYAGDSGKVYEINADSLNIFNLNDPITEEMKATLQRELNGKDKQFRNSVLRNFRSEKVFTDFESAERFFDEQRKLWKEEDGYYAANKPDIKSANDKTGEAVIEYTDFANIDNAIGNLTGNELYDALKSISTDDFASFITGHGFDGISFDEDADNQQYVIYRNEDRLNILNNDIAPTPDVQYSLSAETDAEYMSAVERGDTETAQMMVDEAAKKAGYDYHLYHGTDADFTKFDLRKFGGRNGKGEGYGIYLAANREISAPYGKNVINSYTKFNRLAEGRRITLTKAEVKRIIQKSCDIEAKRMVDDGEYDSFSEAVKDTWVSNYVYTYDYPNMSQVYTEVADVIFGGNDNDGDIINEIMSASGGHYNYDGALDFYDNVLTPTTGIDGFHYIWGNTDGSGEQNDIYLAFNSEQIKSADPITYDDNGNVIPLSQRFNAENEDIRYSLSKEGKEYAPVGTPFRELALNKDIESVFGNIAPVGEGVSEAPMQTDVDGHPLPDDISDEETVPLPESSEDIVKTVKERLNAKITNSTKQLEETKLLRDWVKASYENKIAKLQEKYDSKKNKETKVAVGIKRRIANLKRLAADLDTDLSKRISDIEERISKTAERMEEPPKKDILEVRYERINNQLEADKAALAEEYAKRKAEAEKALADKPSYFKNKALALYEEVRGMRKGVKVSKELGYLLDNLDLSDAHKAESYKRLRQALIDIKNRPSQTVNQYSEIESIAREMINASYENDVYALDEQYQAEVEKLEADAEAQKKAIREQAEALRRADVQRQKLDEVNSILHSKGFDLDEMLDNPVRQLSTLETVDTMPQRVLEKTFGYEAGQALSDATVNKIAQNETEGIKWLDSITNRKTGLLAQLSKQYNIKPHSKEIAAAMMYGEGSWVDEETGEEFAYGDAELAKDFPDVKVQNNIKALVADPRIRQFYDETLDAINAERKANGYPEIPKRANYFLHYREMGDFFTKHGLPFNPNDARAKDLPTDMVGRTADLKPGQPFFTSSWQRKGNKTSYDLFEGIERYANSAKNQIFHIGDIQTLRALHYHLAERFGQAQGLENLNKLTPEAASEQIKKVYGSHLSTFAAFLDTEANILAGKTSMIDRALSEGMLGRRILTFMDTLNKQTGATMVGYGVSSANTNWLPAVQEFANANPVDSVKALAQTVANIASRGKFDSFREDSTVYIRRQGADRFNRKLWQKLQDPAYALMGAVDSISTEIIARTEYNKAIREGMSAQEAHYESDKKVSRLMADRSLGQMPQMYTSRMLGLVTKFQLEVRNYLDSAFYDTLQEEKVAHKDIENALERNAKTAAKVAWRYGATAIAMHMFGKAFESVAGYNPAFDIIEAITKAFGWDDDEDDEDTWRDNLGEGAMSLLEDLPYASIFLDGGRIPISSALPDFKGIITGKDEYGNEKTLGDSFIEIAPYMLPAGGNQFKKTYQGLKMFSDDHPVSGSYTDSGSLRFPVEDTPLNRVQAALFGQYASKNAREYFDNGYAPLSEKQIQEYIDVDMPIKEYREYREGLKKQETLEDKFDYISGLDLPVAKKNILINNVVDRKEAVDLEDYEDFGSLEEFDFATKNPEKYAFAKSVGGYSAYQTYSDALYNIKADKDENGKSINGSRKEKVLNYINNLDADFYTKVILFKSEYPSDDTYNRDIVSYINERSDLSYEDKVAILTELGFRVTADGQIYAD